MSPPVTPVNPPYNPPYTPPVVPKIPGLPSFPYGSTPSTPFGKKRSGMFHEYLKGINYNMFNVRTGTGARAPSLREKKGQGVNLFNVAHATKGEKYRAGKGWTTPQWKPEKAPKSNQMPKVRLFDEPKQKKSRKKK
jgi:hypothetical protein